MATQLTLNDGSLNSAGALAIKTNGTTQAINITTGQQVEFNDGSASAPSITNTGDGNTGVFFPDADTVGITTGGTERARVDSSGNLGLGVTPSAWNSNRKAIQTGNAAFVSAPSVPAFAQLSANNYTDSGGTDRYISTAAATTYAQVNGQHQWFYAASGTAGNAITFTQAMTLDASGNLGVGSTSISSAISGSAKVLGICDPTNTNLASVRLSSGSTLSSGNRMEVFSSASSCGLRGEDSNPMVFSTAATERARITSSGDLLVGTTTARSKLVVEGGQLSVGSTGSTSQGIYLYINNALSDNSYLSRGSAGSGTTTWYIGNQAITTSSDQRLKADIKPSERNALDLLNQWEIVDHTWNDPSDQCENNRNSRGVWTGVVAQQVQQVTPWLVNKPTEDVNEDGSINPWTMDFGYAVPLLVKALQEMKAIVDAQAAEIAALKG